MKSYRQLQAGVVTDCAIRTLQSDEPDPFEFGDENICTKIIMKVCLGWGYFVFVNIKIPKIVRMQLLTEKHRFLLSKFLN